MADKNSPKDLQADLAWIRALADVLSETGLSEIEIEKNNTKLRVARQISAGPMAAPIAVQTTAAVAPETPAPAAAASASDHPGAVKAPMIGTVYHSPQPGAPNFVTVGDKVREGDTLMIIEAMKTMNEIKAPRNGTVSEVIAKNEEPVEFGEPLLILS